MQSRRPVVALRAAIIDGSMTWPWPAFPRLSRFVFQCAMGGMTPLPVLSALDHFPEDFGTPGQQAA